MVAVRDGRVLRFDLGDPADVRRWAELATDVRFHESVTSVSVGSNGSRMDLPLPRRFRDVRFDAEVIVKDGERVGERVTAYADSVSIQLTMYTSGRSRVDLERIGRRRWIPGS